MAKYDHGGGCPCGLYKECDEACREYKAKEVKMKLNEDDDFGFTFGDSKDPEKYTADKLQGLRDMIMPLLNNLMKNPEKDTILWPNREKKIKEFIKKMDDYINT